MYDTYIIVWNMNSSYISILFVQLRLKNPNVKRNCCCFCFFFQCIMKSSPGENMITYLCSLILFFNYLFNFIWQWSCHPQIWRDYNNGYIKSPTNSTKKAKLSQWKRLKSKIFWSPFGKSDWLMNSKCLSNTVQHMWKWAIIPFFVCLNQNFLSVSNGGPDLEHES